MDPASKNCQPFSSQMRWVGAMPPALGQRVPRRVARPSVLDTGQGKKHSVRGPQTSTPRVLKDAPPQPSSQLLAFTTHILPLAQVISLVMPPGKGADPSLRDS